MPRKIAAPAGALAREAKPDACRRAARAIMTTDTFPKLATRTREIDGVKVTINGIAKGAGMIPPDMATMLAFVFTDAAIAPRRCRRCSTPASTAPSTAITIDGDTSTSDTLLLFATGRAASAVRRASPMPTIRGSPTSAALHDVLRELALQVAKDGEGATKFVTIDVTGAETTAGRARIALSIANSPLVKTAIAGEDANWGRIVMAVGKAGEAADRDKLSIWFGDFSSPRTASAPVLPRSDGAPI